MTSGDTNAKTMELLDANAYFGPLESFEVVNRIYQKKQGG